MTRRSTLNWLTSLGAFAALSGFAVGSALAEVRAVEHPNRGWTVEIEPSASGKTWTPVEEAVFDEHVLNPGGDLHADGQPAVGIRPTVGLPEAVFAKASPQGYHLIFAKHDGEGWAESLGLDRTPFASDINPVLAYDDVGRSMLLWQRTVDVWAVMIGGLSIDGRMWGRQVTEPLGFVPLAMQTDGHEFYFATLNPSWGVIRFRLAAFPFPNGGPALPFPDDTLQLALLDEVVTGADEMPRANDDGPSLGSRPDSSPATLAGLTLKMHRHEATVWADWVTDRGVVEWIAFRGRQIIDRGEEPYRSPGQIDQARERIRRHVEGL